MWDGAGRIRTLDRGFRGIGRLSALAFAEQVQLHNEDVRYRAGDGGNMERTKRYATQSLAQVDATTAIERCTTIRKLLHGRLASTFL